MTNPALGAPVSSLPVQRDRRAVRPVPPSAAAAGVSRGWRPVVMLPLLAVSLLLTALAGLAIGWFAVWFQLFGGPDGGDYLVAAGAFATTALVLVLGLPAARAVRAPGWVGLAAAAGTTVHLVLALVAAAHAATAARPAPGLNGWQDGALAVLVCPWAWPVLALAALGAVTARPRPAEA